MGKKDSNYNIGVKRYPLATPRDCSLGVITFNKLRWTNYAAKILDLSIIGAGIELSQKIEPGLIWFNERVGGYKCGVLRWSGRKGPAYRAGIEFLPLSRDEEEYLRKQIEQTELHKPVLDPEHIITTLVETAAKQQEP
jgi:hypothetical protein